MSGNSQKKYELGCRLGYQGPRSEFPPPAHCEKYAKEELKILQINISGLQNKKIELEKLLDDHNIQVALIQETILPKKPEISLSKYSKTECTCKTNHNIRCQGIMTLIRKDITGKVENLTTNDIDWQKATIWTKSNTKFTIHNFYCPSDTTTELPLLNETTYRTILAGDFNAHTPDLGYERYNNMGKEIEALCNERPLNLLQSKLTPPTCLHRRHGTTSRPDLTLISTDLLNNAKITVLDDIGSDHLPILTTITQYGNTKPKTQRCTYWNFKKANWKEFGRITDAELEQIDQAQPIEKLYSTTCKIILKAAKKTIPRGNRKKFKPFWTTEIGDVVKLRRKARKKMEKHPNLSNKREYNKLTAKVRHLTKSAKSKAWKENCEQLDLNKEGHKTWKLLHSLEGKATKTNQQPLLDTQEETTCNKKKAEIFNRHFANVNKSQRREPLDSGLWKATKRTKAPTREGTDAFETPFSLEELNTALKRLQNRKASGTDEIKNELLKNLGGKAKLTILKLINRSWTESYLPSAWRTAIISPILKKEKPPDQPQSYRPISLTSCMSKLAERMVNNRLYWWLESNKLISDTQAGFRKGCRTEDQLFRLVQSVQQGFKEGKHTFGVFVDLQQAYDKVWRKGLLIKMQRLGIQGFMYKWIQAFLNNRTIATKHNGMTSSKQTLEEGLPQGSPLSCTLFLIYINDLPEQLKVSKAMFADDLILWTTDKYPIIAKAKLQRDLHMLHAYCNLWKLKINNKKTVYSIFTLSHKIATKTLNLKLENEQLNKENNPVYLGVKLDIRMTLNEHLENVKKKASMRLNLVKRLATTTWGANKQTLRQIYLGYVRSIMDYNLPLQNTANKNAVLALDRVQNQALRLICGALRTTPTAACEIEANIGPRDLHRQRSLVETVERYRRLNKEHPNRLLVDTWKPVERIQLKTLLDVEQMLSTNQHLPENREKDAKFQGNAPWTTLRKPEIKTTLLDEKANKKSNPTHLKQSTLETIQNFPSTIIHVYTDGSAFKATTKAGYGILLKYPDGTSSEHCDSCGENCSNYEAEAAAIKTAIQIIYQNFELTEITPSDIVLFSDSKSVLQTLQNPPYQDKVVLEIAEEIDRLLTAYDIQITLQWIPGHNNISGNDKADRLAKSGATKPQKSKPCSQNTVKQMLKNNEKEDWLNRWAAGSTGRAMFKEMPLPKPQDAIRKLNRHDQSLIFQFRTTHSRTNYHLNRINPQHLPLCRHCNHPYETTEHLLLQCPSLINKRKELLPPTPSIQNILYGPAEQLRKTADFIRLTLTVKE